MDGQVTARTLVCAIPKNAVVGWLTGRLAELCRTLEEVAATFLKPGIGPADAHGFEDGVEKHVRERSRSFSEWCFNALPSPKVEAMPQQVEHLGQTYRRLKKKTRHASVLTRFGNITLTKATYRQGRRTQNGGTQNGDRGNPKRTGTKRGQVQFIEFIDKSCAPW